VTLADAERLVILARLRRLKGDKPATAESLGICLKTLYSRINAYVEQGHRIPPPPRRPRNPGRSLPC
jgi:DNA-binding NtrC family response regulator